jgi:hypothetical protein
MIHTNMYENREDDFFNLFKDDLDKALKLELLSDKYTLTPYGKKLLYETYYPLNTDFTKFIKKLSKDEKSFGLFMARSINIAFSHKQSHTIIEAMTSNISKTNIEKLARITNMRKQIQNSAMLDMHEDDYFDVVDSIDIIE